ncbi:MAG: sigma-70 family RNA polymerase sigma factor [Myxococcota bacterium]
MSRSTEDYDRIQRHLERRSAGDDDASMAEWLFGTHHAAILAQCRRALPFQEAEEIAQDVFSTALERLETFERAGSVRGWLMQIARFKILNARRKIREQLIDDDRLLYPASATPGPPRMLRRKERAALLMRALSQLPADRLRAFELFHINEVSYQEIEQQMDLPAGKARVLLQAARRQLRREIEKLLDEAGHTTSLLWTKS